MIDERILIIEGLETMLQNPIEFIGDADLSLQSSAKLESVRTFYIIKGDTKRVTMVYAINNGTVVGAPILDTHKPDDIHQQDVKDYYAWISANANAQCFLIFEYRSAKNGKNYNRIKIVIPKDSDHVQFMENITKHTNSAISTMMRELHLQSKPRTHGYHGKVA